MILYLLGLILPFNHVLNSMKSEAAFPLFGGEKKWVSADWTDSDDRVRGGKSQSYLELLYNDSVSRFYGNLDTETLGGAGFASQRTTGENRSWDLSLYDGIEIRIKKSDGKRYTFNLKDALLPNDPDSGREQASISYEYDFQMAEDSIIYDSSVVFIPWNAFNATYRGREQKDAPEVNKSSIKRVGVMMRSFFGEQEGDFSLQIQSISAVHSDSGVESSPSGSSVSTNVEDKRRQVAVERREGNSNI